MSNIDISTSLGGLKLDSPIIPASGTFGFGKEFSPLYDLNILGSIAFKGTTLNPRLGNPLPRIAECPMGLINSVGLQNPGLQEVINVEIPNLCRIFQKPLIANISGFSTEEYVACAKAMDDVPQVGIIEVNVSCPNVHNGGMAYGVCAESAAEITSEIKKVCKNKPVYIKLSPNVTNISEIAVACEKAGADGLSLINTVLAMRIDINTGKPVIANTMGGLSGPAIFPIAVRMVYQVASSVNIPIIGMGGINSAEDVIEMMMAGASAVQIGAANLVEPFICKKITDELPIKLESLGYNSLREIIGKTLKV